MLGNGIFEHSGSNFPFDSIFKHKGYKLCMVKDARPLLVVAGSVAAFGLVFGMDKGCRYIGDNVALPALHRLSESNPDVRKTINYAALGEPIESAYQKYLKGWNEGFRGNEKRPKTFQEFKRYVENEDLLKDR